MSCGECRYESSLFTFQQFMFDWEDEWVFPPVNYSKMTIDIFVAGRWNHSRTLAPILSGDVFERLRHVSVNDPLPSKPSASPGNVITKMTEKTRSTLVEGCEQQDWPRSQLATQSMERIVFCFSSVCSASGLMFNFHWADPLVSLLLLLKCSMTKTIVNEKVWQN